MRASHHRGRSRRVRRLLSLAALAIALWPLASAANRQAFTVNPVMSRGPADAAVTIVEFSDYQ
jgi:hypothetical protein